MAAAGYGSVYGYGFTDAICVRLSGPWPVSKFMTLAPNFTAFLTSRVQAAGRYMETYINGITD